MTPVEDVLRQAYAAAAQTVTWDDIAPTVPGLEETKRARRGQRLTIAVLAAAATAVVAIVAALLPGLLAHRPAPPATGHKPGHGAQPSGFFAELPPGRGTVQIRSALTGGLIAAVPPPAKGEFFSGVAATGADGRTLLLAVEHNTGACKTWLYQLRLTPAGQPGPLEPAAIPSFHGILPEPAFAAAPDGSAIAFAAYFCNGSGRFEIDRPGTGVSASWATNGGDQFDSLSLSDDGAAVSVSGYEYAGEGPGAKQGTSSTRLQQATAVLQARSANSHLDGQGVITRKYGAAELSRDGKTLYACSSQGRRKVLRAYDVATRELRKTVATWAGSCSFALDKGDNYALISTASGRLARLDIRTGRLTLLAGSSAPYPVSLTW